LVVLVVRNDLFGPWVLNGAAIVLTTTSLGKTSRLPVALGLGSSISWSTLPTAGAERMTEQLNVDTVVFSDINCDLGESALWDDARSRFYWVDITGRKVFARDWSGGATRTLTMPDLVGSVALRASGGLVAALRHSIAFCDVDHGTVDIVRTVEVDMAGNRFNDGAVDPGGRFWFGSMDMAETDPTGAFYCFHTDTTVTRAFGGTICSNGPAWSPDGRTVYHVDSARRLIRAYDFDPDTATIGAGRVFVSDEGHEWYPDGVTVDADGYIWNCKWDGGRIVRYAPDATVDRVLLLPVPRPTRCAFVGPDLDTLAVTSARIGLDADALANAPLSGQVLLVDPGARGSATSAFAG
jgi:sugar lactone lactonase YvrE